MESTHLTDDLLSLATAGMLDPGDVTHIEQHTRHCTACEERLRDAMVHRARLLARGVPKRAASGQFTMPARASAPERRPGRSRTWRAAAGMALAAGVVLMFFVLRPQPESHEVYWIPAGAGLTISRSAAVPDEQLVHGIELYHSQDSAGAQRLLEDLEVGPAYENLRRLYLASACLNQGEPTRALEVLPDSIHLPSHRAGQAQWIRFLALKATGQNAVAADLLRELALRQDTIGAQARETLSSH